MPPKTHPARSAPFALLLVIWFCSGAAGADQSAEGAGPGSFTIDADAAERALERTLVSTGSLVLPRGQAEVAARLGFTRISQEMPVLLVQQDAAFVASQVVRQSVIDAALGIKLGLWQETQLELDVPWRLVQEDQTVSAGGVPVASSEADGAGAGDVRVGVAHAFGRIVGRLEWDSGSGRERDDGVLLGGSGYDEVEGSLSATRRQDPLVFTGRLSYRVAWEKNAIKPGDTLGLSLGTLLAASPETSLRLELDQYFVRKTEVAGNTVPGSDQVVAMLLLGASSIIGRGEFVDLTVASGVTEGAPNYAVVLSYSRRFTAL